MLQRVYIQILDNPMDDIVFAEERINDSVTNKILAEELQKEMSHFYPFVVSVEYVDLFMDDEEAFPEIRELLRHGAINTPVVLINGIPKIHGGIPYSVIRKEVEHLLSSGPVH
ncbi:MAG: hypothetical protein HY755_12330 [Nitrospirae bacterium]|nr:hypothetical protein [Nitrospirota bacterium]